MKTIIFLYLSENCCISLSFWKLLDILYLSKNYYDLCIHLKIIIFLYVYLKTIKSLYLFKNCYDLCIYLKIIISLYLSENCFISVSIWKLLWSLYLSENYYISVSIWKLLYHCIYLNLLYVVNALLHNSFSNMYLSRYYLDSLDYQCQHTAITWTINATKNGRNLQLIHLEQGHDPHSNNPVNYQRHFHWAWSHKISMTQLRHDPQPVY